MYNYLTSAFPPAVCGMLRLTVRFQRITQKAGQLNTYNLDRATIILIVCMGFIRTRLGIPNEIYYKAWIFGTAILILIGLIKYYKRIPKTNWRWAGIGLLFCVSIIPISIVEMIYPDRYSAAITDFQVGFEFVREIIYNLSFVSLMEEITFRSLVWGSFRQFGMKESSIIVVQGVAFWLIHLPRLIYPLSFLITIPVGMLIYSFLTYRSKQVFPSIILHTIFNAAGPIFVRLLLR